MSGGNGPVPDEDLIKAVRERCKFEGKPVVKTAEVANAESIHITPQRVHDRLKRLHEENRVGRIKVGRGSVWWVPEEVDVDVDFSSINWEEIDGSNIPPDTIEEHPEYHANTYWEDKAELARSGINIFGTAILFGILAFLTRDWDIPFVGESHEEIIELIGAISLFAGLIFGVLSLLVLAIAFSSQYLIDEGIWGYIVNRMSDSKFREAIPSISITVDWGDEGRGGVSENGGEKERELERE